MLKYITKGRVIAVASAAVAVASAYVIGLRQGAYIVLDEMKKTPRKPARKLP